MKSNMLIDIINKISKFLLPAIYVVAVILITTVGVKAYIRHTEEKVEEQQNLEEAMTMRAGLDVDTMAEAYEEWYSSGVQSGQNNNIEQDTLGEADSSYEKTLKANQTDKQLIMENKYDFSHVKIACLGDSLTAASNLEYEENYKQYAYPSILKELLGAEEVYNLGIGGSSIGRYWSEPFVERYMDIPEDTDIIIVMGGINDGYCASEAEFGSLEERKYGTFCGDLDELMRGIKEHYPNAVVFFASPPSNAMHGVLMIKNAELLPQECYALAIEVLAKAYGFEFIDLYYAGFLDSYDENIVKEFIPDAVHGSHEGYRVLAEHFAGEIVKYYNSGMQ